MHAILGSASEQVSNTEKEQLEHACIQALAKLES